jgi:hypothetical protein
LTAVPAVIAGVIKQLMLLFAMSGKPAQALDIQRPPAEIPAENIVQADMVV